jgi:hydroxyacylglutathione hydrolase
MLTVKKFEFNPFHVNTFLLFDETRECAIIDAGCYEDYEKEEITGFIEENGLKPARLLNTHSHIDHIIGNAFMAEKYGLKLEAHKDGLRFLDHARENGYMFGIDQITVIRPEVFIDENDTIRFGNTELEVVSTPGHAAGSLCFINRPSRFVIVGDVLFYQSIGRTDLPSGNYKLLLQSIYEKLFILPDNFTVYCGHGPETTIGFEKAGNPFLAEI